MKLWTTLLLAAALTVNAEDLTADAKAKVEAKLTALSALGSDAKVVTAVKTANATPPAEAVGMTQEKWKGLTLLSPEVKAFSKNELATYLKGKKDESVSELFVNAADGSKVAFFAKTSGWIHKGKAKHDKPMTGKTWIGEVEVDESTGQKQVQVAFPVMEGGKAIGSVVVGLSISKL